MSYSPPVSSKILGNIGEILRVGQGDDDQAGLHQSDELGDIALVDQTAVSDAGRTALNSSVR